jgi:hypothetical protein
VLPDAERRQRREKVLDAPVEFLESQSTCISILDFGNCFAKTEPHIVGLQRVMEDFEEVRKHVEAKHTNARGVKGSIHELDRWSFPNWKTPSLKRRIEAPQPSA